MWIDILSALQVSRKTYVIETVVLHIVLHILIQFVLNTCNPGIQRKCDIFGVVTALNMTEMICSVLACAADKFVIFLRPWNAYIYSLQSALCSLHNADAVGFPAVIWCRHSNLYFSLLGGGDVESAHAVIHIMSLVGKCAFIRCISHPSPFSTFMPCIFVMNLLLLLWRMKKMLVFQQ